MASTIQIKRGTGSAVPSGLSDGELAINLDSGKLYFGSGSTSVNSFRFTNLTADNYIVSSSVTNYTFQTLSGSSDFGNDTGDIHNRTGSLKITGSLQLNGSNVLTSIPINVSGLESLKINASSQTGSLTVGPAARQIELRGGSTFTSTNPRILSSTGTIEVDDALQMNSHPIYFHEGATNSYIGVDVFTPDNLRIHANQDLYLVPDDNLIISSSTSAKTISHNDFDLRGELTASGNISSSGTIVASNLSGTNTGDQDLSSYSTITQLNASSSTLQTNIDAKSSITQLNASSSTLQTNIDAKSSITQLNASSSTLQGNINAKATTGSNVIFANITSSGNISSSGTIVGSNLSGTNTGDQDLSSYSTITQLNASSSTLQTNIDAKAPISNPSFTGNVTASGNISASGTVTANLIVGTVGTATQGTIDHDSLANFVANEHIDHSGVSITAGAGLTGGGTIAATRTLSINSASIAPFFSSSANNFYTVGFVSASGDLTIGGKSQFIGNITASGNISSSGDIYSSRYFANEQLALNNVNGAITLGYDNTYPINIGKSTNPIGIYGNITSSGNISSSGNIYSNEYYTDGYSSLNTSGTQGRVFSAAAITGIQIGRNGTPNKNIELLGPVTASGNISASGTIVASNLLQNSDTASFVVNSQTGSFSTITQLNASSSTLQTNINGKQGTLTFGKSSGNALKSEEALTTNDILLAGSSHVKGRTFTELKGDLGLSTSDNVTFGTISATSLNVTSITSSIVTSSIIQTEGSNIFGDAISDTHTFTGHITASANISSSGEIEANTFKAAGNVDFNGDLDVDGTTNLDAVDIDGNVQLDGTFTVGVDDTGYDVTLFGATSGRKVVWDASHDHLKFEDNTKLLIGTGPTTVAADTSLSHDGTDFTFANVTGKLNIENSSGDTNIKNSGTNASINLILDASAAGATVNDGTVLISGSAEPGIRLDIRGEITASGNISSSGTVTANSIVGTVGTATQGTIDHDSLANFVANEHIDHSGVSITAGAGLTGGGTIASTRDIAVGAGTGVTVNANDVAIGQDVATTANVLFNHITASGNISSSGDLITDQILLNDGNKIIGHHGTDGFQIRSQNTDPIVFKTNGNNIRATISSTGEATFTNVVNATKLNTGQGDNELYAMNQDVETTDNVLFNNITASGNISASGNLITTTLQFTGTDTSEDATHYLEFKKPANSVSNITNGVTINPSSDTLVLGGITTIAGQAGTITGLTSLTSTNITASGHISASGTVFTDTISSPSNNLTISSSTVTITSTTAGEANLILESDTDNNDENDNPFMLFTQDGGAINGYLGLTGDADKWPDGGTLTGATPNALVLGTKGPTTSTNSQLFLAAGDSASLRIANDADIHIYENLNVTKTISVDGFSVVDYGITNANTLTFGTGNRDSIFQGTAFNVQTAITASGDISASGNFTAAAIGSHGHNIGFFDGTNVNLGFENNTPIQIGKVGNPTTIIGHITASGDISASGNILTDGDITATGTITTEAANQAQILISSLSTSTNRDVGLLLSSSANGQQYAIALDRANDKLVIAPDTVNNAPGSAVVTIDATGTVSASGEVYASRFMGPQLTIMPFNYFVSANKTSELYVPVAGSQTEGTSDQFYHYLLNPYGGMVRRVSVSYQTGDPGEITARIRKAAAPFDLDDSGDIVQTEIISSTVDDTMYFFDFSASFAKGDAVSLTIQSDSQTDNTYVAGIMTIEYDTTT